MRRTAAVTRWGLVWQGLLLVLLGALWTGGAAAQSLESALRPGELVRAHAKWDDDCSQCHVRFDRAAQNERCSSCHKDVGADVKQHTGYHGRLKPQACRTCHTDHKGRDARIVELDKTRFDHGQTDYALRGKHIDVRCDSCHVAGRKYSQAAHDCVSCHAKHDTHKGGLGKQCADCHREDDWKQTRFDHGKTRFELTGRHADTRCTDCHRNNVYKDAPRTCIGCHRKDDDAAKGHRGRFGERCDSCHGTKAWKPATFNHDTETRFALKGKHRGTGCTACHTGASLYRDKVGTACVDCHRKDDKHEGGLGRDCQACHGERDWKETGRFDHDRTTFALLGQHRELRCEACHQGQRYAGTPTTCVACHRQDDPHKPSLGERCESCHGATRWKDVARFNHDKARLVLRERHAELRCDACHRSANYREAPRTCDGCHQRDDRHADSLGSACADCHSERRWVPAPRFDHQRTRFPLRNAHAASGVACKACHATPRDYRPTPQDCVSCHIKDDKHEAQLGTRCESCHDDARWKSVRFDHARARFALVGRHVPLACSACHSSLRYRDATRDCVGCHRQDDKHKQRYGTACDSCHNARSWALWTFDHRRRTPFALDGAHATVACDRCHTQPAPSGRAAAELGTACVACHARDDRHDGAFGTQCERCHDSINWRRINQAAPARTGQAGPVPGLGVRASLGQASWFARHIGLGRTTS